MVRRVTRRVLDGSVIAHHGGADFATNSCSTILVNIGVCIMLALIFLQRSNARARVWIIETGIYLTRPACILFFEHMAHLSLSPSFPKPPQLNAVRQNERAREKRLLTAHTLLSRHAAGRELLLQGFVQGEEVHFFSRPTFN